MADEGRLGELFESLFENAVDHGGESVTVGVGPLENGFYFEDDGPGIPTELDDRVFEHGFSSSSGNRGLWLSVVETIVGAHGWAVEVTESESGGARFEITGVEFVG